MAHDPDDLAALRAASDVLGIDALLTDQERAVRDRVRAFVDEEIRPHVGDWFDRGYFPVELASGLGGLGVLGMTLDGYGCAGRSAVEYGLAALELEAGDSGIRTFVSVQGSLAMGSIHRWGSEEQKQEWLPPMARGDVIGSFGLTEPSAGSDPSSM
ncbi:MAG: acyl-CoA dehydrogenase family protein, partial [Microbacterium sp.]